MGLGKAVDVTSRGAIGWISNACPSISECHHVYWAERSERNACSHGMRDDGDNLSCHLNSDSRKSAPAAARPSINVHSERNGGKGSQKGTVRV